MRVCLKKKERKIYGIWLSVFRHATRRRNVRTAPTMMPKQYTHKRALRLRQNFLLKLVLNLRARSICELYIYIHEKWISDKKKSPKAKDSRDVISRRWETIVTYLKCKLVYSACGIVLYVSIRYKYTIRLRLREKKIEKRKEKVELLRKICHRVCI